MWLNYNTRRHGVGSNNFQWNSMKFIINEAEIEIKYTFKGFKGTRLVKSEEGGLNIDIFVEDQSMCKTER